MVIAFPRRNKFGNRKTGGKDSKAESMRAHDLRIMQRIGVISDLKEQVRFELIPKQDGERAVTYVADFTYLDEKGALIVEDKKGFRTPEYILKRKLMLYRHGIRVLET